MVYASGSHFISQYCRATIALPAGRNHEGTKARTNTGTGLLFCAIAPSRHSDLCSSTVKIYHSSQGSLTHRTKRHLVTREHHAVDLGPIVAARFVHRAFESADGAGVLAVPEQSRLLGLLHAEERVHLGLRTPGDANRT